MERELLLRRLLEEREAGVSGGIYHGLQVLLCYNSNHIEGSCLTERQTRMIYETGQVVLEPGSVLASDAVVETSGHFRAFDDMLDVASRGALSAADLCRWHSLLFASSSKARLPWFAVGCWKRMPNSVGGLTTTAPGDVEEAMGWVLSHVNTALCGDEEERLERVVECHVEMERVHPFQDGNGRVGRLLLLWHCLRAGIVPVVILERYKAFYYMGLQEWPRSRSRLLEVCRAGQEEVRFCYLS